MDPNSTASSNVPAPVGMERRVFILFSIALVAVLFVGMVGLLWWRERPAPTALLVLRVPPAQDGAIATVDTTSRDLSPIVVPLHGNQEVRIPLPPGNYTVIIEKDSRRIGTKITLSDYSYFPILLGDHPATQPTKSK